MKEMSSKYLYIFLLVTVILLWSYGWVLTKIGLSYMRPFTFAALRFLLASIAMIVVLSFLKASRPKGKEWIILFIMGLLQTTAMFLLINYGMMFVNVSKSSILIYSMPIWSGILGYIFLHESLGALLVTIGVYLATVAKPKERHKIERSSINIKS
ncbi:DMT family transporter [Parageobacillus toebii]|uniref:DMT family transporter n=1 Tax=Parageobacillus toebii TaxID=153151 RepID=UPI001F08018C|nr:DMT family transporter [Parageobacillus toebii]